MNSTTGNEIDPSGVNHPSHYNLHRSGMECIDLVRTLPFGLGCAVKYLWRAGLKGSTQEDLKKARWYIEDTLNNLCPCDEPGDDTAPQTVYMRQLREQFGRFEQGVSRVENLTPEERMILLICDSVLESKRTCLLHALATLNNLILTSCQTGE